MPVGDENREADFRENCFNREINTRSLVRRSSINPPPKNRDDAKTGARNNIPSCNDFGLFISPARSLLWHLFHAGH